MTLRHIVFGGIRRRKGKALLIVVGLTMAVMSFVLVSSLILSMRRSTDEQLSKYGANLIVSPARAELSLAYGGFNLGTGEGGTERFLEASAPAAVRSIADADSLAAVIPVRLATVEVRSSSGESGSVLAAGTDLRASADVKPWWRVEGSLPAAPDQVLAGLNVRNEFGFDPGDRITVSGREVVVSGVLQETGDEEDNLLFMSRETLNGFLGDSENIDLIEVSTVRTGAVEAVRAQIQEVLPQAEVVSVRESIEFNNRADGALAAFGLAAGLLVAVIAGFVVMATMLTAVQERQREIGVFRAVGYGRRHIAVLVLLEALILSGVGAIAGIVLALIGMLLLPAALSSLELAFALNPAVVAVGIGVAFAVGLGAALYPSRRAANLDPASALRNV